MAGTYGNGCDNCDNYSGAGGSIVIVVGKRAFALRFFASHAKSLLSRKSEKAAKRKGGTPQKKWPQPCVIITGDRGGLAHVFWTVWDTPGPRVYGLIGLVRKP
jgi:hypothetical protein